MELDELKARWEATDRRLDANLRLTARLVSAPLLRKSESSLTRLRRIWQIELVLVVAVAAWLGWFNWNHITEPRFLIPGLMLHAGAIALIICYVRQIIITIRSIDYASPIVGIQKQMESLRITEIHATKWILLLSPLAWTPFLIVAMEGLGVDAFQVFPFKWLAGNALFGVVVLLIERWISYRYADRMARSPRLQQWMRDLNGYNLAAATKFVRSASELEKEAGAA